MSAEVLGRSEIPSDREKAIALFNTASALAFRYGKRGQDGDFKVSGRVPEPQDITGCGDFSISFSAQSGQVRIRYDVRDDEHDGIRGVVRVSRNGDISTRLFKLEYTVRERKTPKPRHEAPYTFTPLAPALKEDIINFPGMEMVLSQARTVLEKRKREEDCIVERPAGFLGVIFSARDSIRHHVVRN